MLACTPYRTTKESCPNGLEGLQASKAEGQFCAQSSSCTHGGIELKAYEYFARVVLLLCVRCTSASRDSGC